MAAWNFWVCAACQDISRPPPSPTTPKHRQSGIPRGSVDGGARGRSGAARPQELLSGILRVRIAKLHIIGEGADSLDGMMYCVCELQGRPESRLQTPGVKGGAAFVWDHAGTLMGAGPGGVLVFTLHDAADGGVATDDQDPAAPAAFRGRAELPVDDVLDASSAGLTQDLRLMLQSGQAASLQVHALALSSAAADAQNPASASACGADRQGAASRPPQRRASLFRRHSLLMSEATSVSVEEEVSLLEEMRRELAANNVDDAMLLACYAGSPEGVRECYDRGATPLSWDHEGRTTGMFALLSGSASTLRQLLEYDHHNELSNFFFDGQVGPDGLTPLMQALLYSHHEVYEFLLDSRGCELKLLGSAWGQMHDGTDAPLHKWLEFLPEITTPAQLPALPKMVLSSLHVVEPAAPTEDQLPEIAVARQQTRQFVRRRLARGSHGDQEDQPEAQNSMGFATLVGVTPTSRVGKRNALPGVAEGAQHGEDGHFDHVGTLITGSLPGMSNDGQGGAMWVCGKCNTMQRHADAANGRVLPCVKCASNIFLRENQVADDSDRNVWKDMFSHDENEDNDEVWGNTGAEFLRDKEVRKHMTVVKRSMVGSLGRNTVRELLTVVKVVKHSKGEVIFRQRDDFIAVYLLMDGEVTFSRGSDRVASVKAAERTLEVLDWTAYIRLAGEIGRHTVTAEVTSDEASLYMWSKKDIDSFCGFRRTEELVSAMSSWTVMRKLKMFSLIEHPRQQELVVRAMELREVPVGEVLATKNEQRRSILVVVKGSLYLGPPSSPHGTILHVGRQSSEVYIQEDKLKHPKAPATEARFFVIGLRSLLFAVGSHTTISVDSDRATCWEFTPQRTESFLESEFSGDDACFRQTLLVSSTMECLTHCALFSHLKEADPRLRELARRLELLDIMENDIIVREGSRSAVMHLLVEGTVEAASISRQDVREYFADMDQRRIRFFGEQCLLGRENKYQTLTVTSTFAQVYTISLDLVKSIFGSMDGLLEEQGTSVRKMLEHMDKVRVKEDAAAATKRPKKPKTDAGRAVVAAAERAAERAAEALGGMEKEAEPASPQAVLAMHSSPLSPKGSPKASPRMPASPRAAGTSPQPAGGRKRRKRFERVGSISKFVPAFSRSFLDVGGDTSSDKSQSGKSGSAGPRLRAGLSRMMLGAKAIVKKR